MEQRYKVGDKVNARAFTDCFGKSVHSTEGLTVTQVKRVTSIDWDSTFKPYYRLTAEGPGRLFVEGAERFFEVVA
jgi:hypothetical protein